MNNTKYNGVQSINNVDADEFKLLSKQGEYIPSDIQADTLFTFATNIEYICKYLEKGYIPARYCTEYIQYLKIKYEKVAIPMKCFCDIRMHDIGKHLECYGENGIAFSKQWGIQHRLQPIHYINTDSFVCEDYKTAFEEILEMQRNNIRSVCNDYILELLLFMKPYQWNFKYRTTGEIKPKCFTEECEWRFVPDFRGGQYKTFLLNENDFNDNYLYELNKCLADEKQYALGFNYDDVKYIIVDCLESYKKAVDCIYSLSLDDDTKMRLISRIIIWSESRGDF